MCAPAIALRTAALLASLSAGAAFRPDHGPRDFNKIDVDGDGLLSSAELEAHTTERLTAEIEGFMSFFDANGDGGSDADGKNDSPAESKGDAG